MVIGSRHIALSYLIREEVVPKNPLPTLLVDMSYSEKHGSVMADLIARATNDHTKYIDDNEKLYSFFLSFHDSNSEQSEQRSR